MSIGLAVLSRSAVARLSRGSVGPLLSAPTRQGPKWVRIHHDSSVSVDARILLRTDDGATIAMTYRGKADKPPAEGGVIYTTPTFETDDDRFTWLNVIQAVGKGRRTGTSLVYELYALR